MCKERLGLSGLQIVSYNAKFFKMLQVVNVAQLDSIFYFLWNTYIENFYA